LVCFVVTQSVFAQRPLVATGTLQSAAVANGNGTPLSVRGLSTALVTINCSVACTGGTTITFQESQDGTHYASVNGLQVGTITTSQTVINQGTTPTLWRVNVSGAQTLRAVVSSYSAGTVTVTATALSSGSDHSVTAIPAPTSTAPFSVNATSTSTYTNVKSTAGSVLGYAVENPNASVCWLQLYNSSAPTVGTSVYFSIPILSSGGIAQTLSSPITFSTAISIATTTTATGSTECSTGMGVTVFFQ
jgi:hypothetical protein